jgi:glutamine---fructose-6-phosphate transaminase (isomerizing)
VAVVEAARAQGRPTVAITNTPDSPLGRAAELVIDLRAGDERAIAATKTYTADAMNMVSGRQSSRRSA